jgi:hypothetical protein
MSSSAISGLNGMVSVPLNPTQAVLQADAKQQTVTEPASASSAVQPILMVPTKPPLSPAVMAELIGRQASPYGSPLADYAGGQPPQEGTTTVPIDQGVRSLPSQ